MSGLTVFTELDHEQQDQDAALNQNFDQLVAKPYGPYQAVDATELETDFPAADYEGAIAYDQGAQVMRQSDGTDWVDMLAGGGGGTPASLCRLVQVANQSINNASFTAVVFDASDAEKYDDDAYHNPSSNAERITVPASLDGVFSVRANVVFAANVTNQRGAILYHKNSGGTLKNRSEVYINATANGGGAGLSTAFEVDLGHVRAVAGDYFYLEVYQDSGGALNIISVAGADTAGTWLEAARISD